MSRSALNNPVHHFKRATSMFEFAGNAIYAPGLFTPLSPTFDQIINYTEFSSLFDLYRINSVVFRIQLVIDPGAQTAANARYPILYYYRDYTDSSVPSSLNEFQENQKTQRRTLTPWKPVIIKIKPNVLNVMYNTSITSTYKPLFKQWLDMAKTNTQHFGIKYAIDDLTNTNYKIQVTSVYYFSCKCTK